MENYKRFYKYILFVVIIIFIIVLGVYYAQIEDKKENISHKKENKIIKKVENKKDNDDSFLSIDIKGAVNNPNVYKLKEGSRVIDVINMAGGLKENADTSIINLSKKITDEMCIIIYTKEDIQKYKNQMLSTNEIKEKLEQENVSIDNFNDAEINKNNKESNTKGNKISINTASIEELMTISGIGESKAKAIISYREENGPFEDIEDIMNVSGIGESLYAKIKDKIEL